MKHGWPTFKSARGKFLLALDNADPVRKIYLKGHPSLKGRMMFVNASRDADAAAFVKINDPTGAGFDKIVKAVKSGFLVRTRADADTYEARRNDRNRAKLATASGAHFISTDFLEPDPTTAPDYEVRFGDGSTMRLNPLTSQ